jgi:hypothetical protein
MTLDLTEDEKLALVAHLRHTASIAQRLRLDPPDRPLEYDPFPYAPRLDPLKAILAKLDPLQAQVNPLSRRRANLPR